MILTDVHHLSFSAGPVRLDLQLPGGVWILQTFPAVIFGLYTGWFRAGGLLAGWGGRFFGWHVARAGE
jgi:hypothetical protein